MSTATTTPSDGVDAVTAEVVSNRLNALCDEGMEAAMQVSASPIVYAVGDVQTGILLADGSPVIGSRGSGGMTFRNAVEATLERCSENPGIDPGDMFVVNDPFLGPRHQPDVMIIAPIHLGERLIGWVGTVCHHLDTGAMTAGGWIPGATEIYQEGYRLPPLKLVEGGELRADVFGAIMNMVRMADKVALDYKGQIAANHVIRRGFLDLCDRYGSGTVIAVLEANIERTRKRLGERIARLPDGEFSQKVFLEQNDGVERSILKYVLKLTKRGDRLRFDFTGTDPQQPGPANSTLINTEEYGISMMVAFQVAPDIEFNAGMKALIELEAPLGSLVNPTPPAPVSAGVSLSSVAIQACLSKLVDCSDDNRDGAGGLWRTIASLMVMISGTLPGGGRFSYGLHDVDGHGSGARTYADGVDTGGDLVHNIALSNVEFHEADSPILFRYRRQAPDTGGPGEYRGGVGLEEAWEPHRGGEIDLTITSFGTEAPSSPGSSGGMPGALNGAYVMRGAPLDPFLAAGEDAAADRLPAAVKGLHLGLADSLYLGTIGGGGYGDPLRREPAAVIADLEGWTVSPEEARQTYGVVLVAGGVEPRLDAAATEALRTELRAARLDRAGEAQTWEGPGPAPEGKRLGRLGAYLEVVEAEAGEPLIRCACGHVFSDVAHSHKEYAATEETELADIPQLIEVPELILRRFYCPGCAVQFWTDVIERGEPIEWDVKLDLGGVA